MEWKYDANRSREGNTKEKIRQQMIKNVYFTPLGELKRRENQIRSYGTHSSIPYARVWMKYIHDILLARRAFSPAKPNEELVAMN